MEVLADLLERFKSESYRNLDWDDQEAGVLW